MAKSTKKGDKNYQAAQVRFIGWLDQLKNYRVLDPACGSGNFLFLGLKTLKDIEHRSHLEAAAMGLEREADLVIGPHNMLGIELNEYAAELARVTVWIGELQWRLLHGYEFKTNPVLEPLDHSECRDALLAFLPGSGAKLPLPLGEGRGVGSPIPIEASWPKANTTKAQEGRPQEAINSIAVRAHAVRIAQAAKRLNDLRENWQNPPEWTQRVPE